jgi:sugar (pentulose or hexulose) kinase
MANRQLIAGVDSSTQSVKVVIRDANTGELVRQGREVLVPPAGEYVADGAAKQAAWALLGRLPTWDLGEVSHHKSEATPEVMMRYRELKNNTQNW